MEDDGGRMVGCPRWQGMAGPTSPLQYVRRLLSTGRLECTLRTATHRRSDTCTTDEARLEDQYTPDCRLWQSRGIELSRYRKLNFLRQHDGILAPNPYPARHPNGGTGWRREPRVLSVASRG